MRAANQSGGKDNITVVLFRVDDDGSGPDDATAAGEDEQDTPSGSDTIHQGLTAVGRAERGGQRDAAAPAAAARAGHAARGGPGGGAGSLPRAAAAPASAWRGARGGASCSRWWAWACGSARARSTSWARTTTGWSRSTAACPTRAPSGWSCTPPNATSSVPARTIPAARRERLLDHEWRSRADGLDLVRQLESGTLDTGASR